MNRSTLIAFAAMLKLDEVIAAESKRYAPIKTSQHNKRTIKRRAANKRAAKARRRNR